MPETDTVDVAIPIDATVAAQLENSSKRALAGRLVSRMLQPASVERLFEVMEAMSAEAARRGLTDEILQAELDAYNAERRGPSPSP